MPADSITPSEKPIVRCPSGLRSDGVRALELATVEGEHLLNCLARRARELDLGSYAERFRRLGDELAELRNEIRRNAR